MQTRTLETGNPYGQGIDVITNQLLALQISHWIMIVYRHRYRNVITTITIAACGAHAMLSEDHCCGAIVYVPLLHLLALQPLLPSEAARLLHCMPAVTLNSSAAFQVCFVAHVPVQSLRCSRAFK